MMKDSIRIILAALAIGFFAIAAPAYAQTPDGKTPANEGICNDLMADGVTEGLYALCVTFCEAQDAGDILHPITEEDYEALLASGTPSGKILENYVAKKTVSDPAMPCIKIEQPCPCWTTEELAEIDGVMWDGYVMFEGYPLQEVNSSRTPYGRRCEDVRFFLGPTIVNALEWDWMGPEDRMTFAQTNPTNSNFPFAKFKHQCVFKRENNAPGGGSTYFEKKLTKTEYENCNASLRAFHANSGFCPAGQP